MEMKESESGSAEWKSCWVLSRRINDKDRLIYKIDENNVFILACRYHYSDK